MRRTLTIGRADMRRVTIAITVAAALAAPVVAAAHARTVTVRVSSLSRPPASVKAGASFRLRYAVRRSGSGLKHGTLEFFASTSKARTRSAVRLKTTASLSRLVKKTKLDGTVTLRAPAIAGKFHILACTASLKAASGHRARGGCGATAGVVKVVKAVTGGPAAPGPNAPTPTPSAPAPDGPLSALDPATPLKATSNPLNVTPTLDPAHAVSATIGTSGGTITTTDAAGTTYSLMIPANALVGDQTITMTPISSIAGLPFDALVGGVDLAPDGLRLLGAATLTITPTSPPPASAQAAFEYSGTGRDFHLADISQDPSKIVISLMHFTGTGVGRATPQQVAALNGRTPTDFEAQAEALEGANEQDLRTGVIDFQTWGDRAITIGQAEWTHVVLPRLQAAESNDLLMDIAFASYFAWAHTYVGTGLFGNTFDADAAEGLAALAKILANAYDQAYARCLNNDPTQFDELLQVASFAARGGFGEFPDVATRLANCARFTLNLTINLNQPHPAPYGATTLQVTSQTTVTLDPTGHSTGALPLTAASFEYFDPICFRGPGAASQKTPGTADLEVDPNIKVVHNPDGTSQQVSKPTFALLLGYGDMYTDSQCEAEAGMHGGGAFNWYVTQMKTDFVSLLDPSTTTRLAIANWAVTGGDPFATFSADEGGGNNLSLELHPAPLK